MTTTTTTNLFTIDELLGFLGSYADEYDIDAIVDEVTEIDYRTGNRYWIELDESELFNICEAHSR